MRAALVLLAVFLLPTSTLAQNTPPVVDAGPDQTIFTDQLTLLQGSATDVDGDLIVGWLWSVDSAPEGSTPWLSEPRTPNPLFSADIDGDYVLSLIAWDGIDWSAPDFVNIHVHQLAPPEAVINVDVTSGAAPLTVQFDGSASFVDPLAGSLAYDWSFGDGDSSVAVAPIHTYDLPGEYHTTLVVVDGLGQSDQDAIDITVLVPSDITRPAGDSGRYSAAGFHEPDDTDYSAIVGGTRSFFVFDLTSITDPRPVVSATLTLDAGTVSGGAFGGITYTLYDVSTPIGTLVAGGDGLGAIYDDLGSGVAFSAATGIAPGASGTEISIPLLPDGVAAVAAAMGGVIAIGGGPSGLGGNFAFSGTDVAGAQLTIEFGEVAIPALSPVGLGLLVTLLAGTGAVIAKGTTNIATSGRVSCGHEHEPAGQGGGGDGR